MARRRAALPAIEWAKLLVALGFKREADWSYLAAARTKEWTLVTRDFKDMTGRGVRLLNPFEDPPVLCDGC